MNLKTIVWRELWERPAATLTGILAIVLAVAALVAIRHVSVFSEQQVARQLQTLGANVLILPKSATLQDYYAADINGQTLPEEHVARVLLAGLPGVEKLSPRLCVPAAIGERMCTLTGILPQSEFQTRKAWQSVNLFTRKHVGCKRASCGPKQVDTSPASLTTVRTIEQLQGREAVLGADLAERMKLKTGSSVQLLGATFQVLAVLPRTGTIDDSRVFAHLHTVQRLAKAGEVVSAIEVLGCCEDAAGQLVSQLADLLPDARIVTISQVVETQVGVNRLMAQTSLCVLVILVLAGGAGMASTISANVRERRREIGTLMALGATPGMISRLFLLKALGLGLTGGLAGSCAGVLLAITCGTAWSGAPIAPLPELAGMAVAAAVGVTVLAAWWPARRAAKLDPCACFQEV